MSTQIFYQFCIQLIENCQIYLLISDQLLYVLLYKRLIQLIDKYQQMEMDIQDEVPQELVCPITQLIFQEPVVATDGHSYEKAVIQLWFASHNISPLTGVPLESKIIIPNHTLKKAVHSYLQKNPLLLRARQQKADRQIALKLSQLDIRQDTPLTQKDPLFRQKKEIENQKKLLLKQKEFTFKKNIQLRQRQLQLQRQKQLQIKEAIARQAEKDRQMQQQIKEAIVRQRVLQAKLKSQQAKTKKLQQKIKIDFPKFGEEKMQKIQVAKEFDHVEQVLHKKQQLKDAELQGKQRILDEKLERKQQKEQRIANYVQQKRVKLDERQKNKIQRQKIQKQRQAQKQQGIKRRQAQKQQRKKIKQQMRIQRQQQKESKFKK